MTGSVRERSAEERIFQGKRSRGRDLSGRKKQRTGSFRKKEAGGKIKIDKQIKSKLIFDVHTLFQAFNRR
jgi:hypothetical protein